MLFASFAHTTVVSSARASQTATLKRMFATRISTTTTRRRARPSVAGSRAA
jgi:hypothetical protein